MSKVRMMSYTPEIEKTIIEIARVSSTRKNKTQDIEGLINYLIKNAHWSPFEHGSVTFEIETSKAIGIQLLRHRSFSFQEFSQRYQDVSKMEQIFQPIELRKQAKNNRQSSSEEFDPPLNDEGFLASELIEELLENIEIAYISLIEAGVARECARMILPMCTTTVIYMTGNLRSWLHFLQVRDDEHAQKEIQIIAKEIRTQLHQIAPNIISIN